MLKVVLTDGSLLTNNMIVNTDWLSDFPEKIIDGLSGKIECLESVGRFSIFMFVFENTVQCSGAMENDFHDVITFFI